MSGSIGIGSTQGKVWGKTRSLFCHNNVECHLIHFKEGGFSSKHKHHSKYNRFVVLDGVLRVKQWISFKSELIEPDTTTLNAGGVTDVPPGVTHCFEAITDGTAIEIYWSDLDPEDIDRGFSCGGLKLPDVEKDGSDV